MAEIMVDNRCRSCGLPFEEGEEAILESRVILTRGVHVRHAPRP